jgi:hypothetical protein
MEEDEEEVIAITDYFDYGESKHKKKKDKRVYKKGFARRRKQVQILK